MPGTTSGALAHVIAAVQAANYTVRSPAGDPNYGTKYVKIGLGSTLGERVVSPLAQDTFTFEIEVRNSRLDPQEVARVEAALRAVREAVQAADSTDYYTLPNWSIQWGERQVDDDTVVGVLTMELEHAL